jgi:hypothetical protein
MLKFYDLQMHNILTLKNSSVPPQHIATMTNTANTTPANKG